MGFYFAFNQFGSYRDEKETGKKFPSLLIHEYCITGNVNVYLIFPNLPNGFETVTIKTLTLIVFVGMMWQTMFVADDVYKSEFTVCVNTI